MDVELDLVTTFAVLLIIFLVTLIGYLAVSGLFTSVEVKTKEPAYGPLVIAYKTDTGPYRNAGALYTESYCLLPNKEQIGIYYDDPEAVPENELRYAVGPILGNADEPPSAMEMEKMRANGFKIAHFPKPNYAVTATFPFRTTLSIYMAIYKVYPKLKAYIAGKSLCAYPALEIYTDHNIVFMMPLSQQDEFFVREFQEEELSIATTDVGSVYNEFTDNESRDSRTPLTEEVPRKDSAGFVIPLAPRKEMSENNDVTAELKAMEEKLIKDRKRLKKKIRKEQDRERMRKGNEQLLLESADETWENRPSKTVNFKDVSPEVIVVNEVNCDEIKDELGVLNHDNNAVLQELKPVNSDSTDSPDSQIIMPTQVTPVGRRKKIRRKRKPQIEPVIVSNDLCSENCFQFNNISLKEEAFDEKDFQLPKEYTSMKLEKVRHDNVLNDSIQIEEQLSQSLLAKSRRRNSSLSDSTHAFSSTSNDTIIEKVGSIDYPDPSRIKSESTLLNEVVYFDAITSNSDSKSSWDSSLESSQIDSSPTRKVKVRRRKPRRYPKRQKTEIGRVSDVVQLLVCERFQCEENEKSISGDVLCSVGDQFVSFWIKVNGGGDEKWTKVAEMSSGSLTEAARTEPLLLIQKGNICLKMYNTESATVIKDTSFVVLGFLDPPETVITAIHCVELIREVNHIASLLSTKVDQSTCGVFFNFDEENLSRGCTLRYSQEFCSTSVDHKVLSSVSGRLVSVRMVEGLSSSMVGLAEVREAVAEMVIWNLESGLCVRTIQLDPRVGLLKCLFREDRLVVILRVGLKMALYVLAVGCNELVQVKTFHVDRSFGESSEVVEECLIKADVLIYKNPALICEWSIGSGKLLKIKMIKNPTVFVSPNEVITEKNGKLFIMN